MNKVITKEYSLNRLAYIGCITLYFSRIDYVIFNFFEQEVSDTEKRKYSEYKFNILRQKLDKRIKKSPTYKDDIKIEYDELSKKLFALQQRRNDYSHSIFILTYRNRNFNLKYNKKDVSTNGLNTINEIQDNELEETCLELINFLGSLSTFLYRFLALEKLSTRS